MVQRQSKRQCREYDTSADHLDPPFDFSTALTTAATTEERMNWKGWSEIESEPAFFNVMLKQLGVKGIKVQEVISLDPEMLALLPKPVYGLVFLYQWREDALENQEETCPAKVWFANQTVSNACASVAILNILNNVPDIDLGEPLRQFKHFTADFTPALRGDAIGNFDFLRQVHNSFARKLDMLNSDLLLKGEAAEATKSKKSHTSKSKPKDRSDATFHFLAFVPVHGTIWKLDGLECQLQNLGPVVESDWIHQLIPEIEQRMALAPGNDCDFAILGLVNDPLPVHIDALASNVRAIRDLSSAIGNMIHSSPSLNMTEPTLDDHSKDPAEIGTSHGNVAGNPTNGHHTNAHSSLGVNQAQHQNILDICLAIDPALITMPDRTYQLSEHLIATASLPQDVVSTLESLHLPNASKSSHDNAFDLLCQLTRAQKELRLKIRLELEAHMEDETKAEGRRHDYGPAIQLWLKYSAQQGILEELEGKK